MDLDELRKPICIDYFQFLHNMITVFRRPEVRGFTEEERVAVLAKLSVLGRHVSREITAIVDEVKGAPPKPSTPTPAQAGFYVGGFPGLVSEPTTPTINC
jgi:hypothetical protein